MAFGYSEESFLALCRQGLTQPVYQMTASNPALLLERDDGGLSALHLACCGGYVHTARVILNAEQRLHEKPDNYTPLALLLDDSGKTALHHVLLSFHKAAGYEHCAWANAARLTKMLLSEGDTLAALDTRDAQRYAWRTAPDGCVYDLHNRRVYKMTEAICQVPPFCAGFEYTSVDNCIPLPVQTVWPEAEEGEGERTEQNMSEMGPILRALYECVDEGGGGDDGDGVAGVGNDMMQVALAGEQLLVPRTAHFRI